VKVWTISTAVMDVLLNAKREGAATLTSFDISKCYDNLQHEAIIEAIKAVAKLATDG
jgi:hypothetical protein